MERSTDEEARIDRLAHGIAVRKVLAALMAKCAADSPGPGFIETVYSDATAVLDEFVDIDAAVWRRGQVLIQNIFDLARHQSGIAPLSGDADGQ